MIQRFGRCLRLTADPEKVGTMELPCIDPYEADEDQLNEWEHIGVDRDAITQDNASKFTARFDLTCKVAECMLDPSIIAMGRLFATTAHQHTSNANGNTAGGGSLLRLMVSRPNEPPMTLPLEDADVTVLNDICKATGRELLVNKKSKEELAAAQWWQKRGALDGGKFTDKQTIWISKKQIYIGAVLVFLRNQSSSEKVESDKAIRQHLIDLKYHGEEPWPGLDRLNQTDAAPKTKASRVVREEKEKLAAQWWQKRGADDSGKFTDNQTIRISNKAIRIGHILRFLRKLPSLEKVKSDKAIRQHLIDLKYHGEEPWPGLDRLDQTVAAPKTKASREEKEELH